MSSVWVVMCGRRTGQPGWVSSGPVGYLAAERRFESEACQVFPRQKMAQRFAVRADAKRARDREQMFGCSQLLRIARLVPKRTLTDYLEHPESYDRGRAEERDAVCAYLLEHMGRFGEPMVGRIRSGAHRRCRA